MESIKKFNKFLIIVSFSILLQSCWSFQEPKQYIDTLYPSNVSLPPIEDWVWEYNEMALDWKEDAYLATIFLYGSDKAILYYRSESDPYERYVLEIEDSGQGIVVLETERTSTIKKLNTPLNYPEGALPLIKIYEIAYEEVVDKNIFSGSTRVNVNISITWRALGLTGENGTMEVWSVSFSEMETSISVRILIDPFTGQVVEVRGIE